MNPTLLSILPLGAMETLAATPFGPLIMAAALSLVAAMLVALSVPGGLTSLSFASGLLLGFAGILVVALGALLGSHALFLVSRRFLGDFMRRRFGERLDQVHHHLSQKGPAYVVGMRLGGVPHLLVTAGCAAAPISARAFAGASLLGMLPAIVLATMAGSTI